MSDLVLVTGSSGLIGSAVVKLLDSLGFKTIGIDNNFRKKFFGPGGDTSQTRENLIKSTKHFIDFSFDISDEGAVEDLFTKFKFKSIVHCAAQPSHDKAALIPKLDFYTNAIGTFNLLESFRKSESTGIFIFMSTNKVYGDNPNKLDLSESKLRFDFADLRFVSGINESLSIDHTTHSLFGTSKASADLLVQEYGRYFNLNTVSLRGGCLTGPQHASVALHGFLSYMIKVISNNQMYEIIGYKGKQVRDQIHSSDIANLIYQLLGKSIKGEAFNIGGGKNNSLSILEILEILKSDYQLNPNIRYNPNNRVGDHICYYTDLSKIQESVPEFKIKYGIREIIDEIVYSSKLT